MRVKQFHSGSSGNLYVVEAQSGGRLLIECGVRWAKLQEALDYDLSSIAGCLISHSHRDHCCSAPDLAKSGIDVYASPETLESVGLADHRRANLVMDKTLITRINGFQVLCFATSHDCEGSLGFVIREIETNEYLLFVTDSSHITQKFNIAFSIIMLECSYDKDILQERVDTGDINESLAKRLLTSHMEWRNTLRYLLDFCDLSHCREVHLLHLSGDNLDK
ncbi:MAG: MBL fold metallo-hydrolase, partial [Planctomycetota bacterium]